MLILRLIGNLLRFQLDTASDLRILNEFTWNRLGKPRFMFSKKLTASVGKYCDTKENLNVSQNSLVKSLKNYSIWPPFKKKKIIASARLRNDLHVVKINSTDIPFLLSRSLTRSNSWMRNCICFVLFSKTPH